MCISGTYYVFLLSMLNMVAVWNQTFGKNDWAYGSPIACFIV